MIPKRFTKSKIIDAYIERIPDITAKTQEQHDLADMFILRTKTADGATQYICEASGTHNLQMLEEAKKSILREAR